MGQEHLAPRPVENANKSLQSQNNLKGRKVAKIAGETNGFLQAGALASLCEAVDFSRKGRGECLMDDHIFATHLFSYTFRFCLEGQPWRLGARAGRRPAATRDT